MNINDYVKDSDVAVIATFIVFVDVSSDVNARSLILSLPLVIVSVGCTHQISFAIGCTLQAHAISSPSQTCFHTLLSNVNDSACILIITSSFVVTGRAYSIFQNLFYFFFEFLHLDFVFFS